MKLCGIYEIRCKSNGKCYIGSSVDLVARLACHKSQLRSKKHINPKLQACWDKHGSGDFEFSILELVQGDPKLAEQDWLDRTLCELNISLSAEAPMRGRKHTVSAKKKLSQRSGWKHTTEARLKISAAGVGRRLSDEAKATISRKNFGREFGPLSEARKALLREKALAQWSNPESRKKIVANRKVPLGI